MKGTVRSPPKVKVDCTSDQPDVAPGQGRISMETSKIEQASRTRLQSLLPSYSYRIIGLVGRVYDFMLGKTETPPKLPMEPFFGTVAVATMLAGFVIGFSFTVFTSAVFNTRVSVLGSCEVCKMIKR